MVFSSFAPSVRASVFGAIVATAALSPDAIAQGRGRGGPPVGTFDVVWRPVRDGTPEVVAIEVKETLRGAPLPESFAVRAPVTYAGVRGIADRVERLTVQDSIGLVALKPTDDPPDPGGFPSYRHWRADRPVRGTVTITYRSLVMPPPGGGPPFGIRATSGGVSGAGSGFLALPEGIRSVTSHVHWDLSDLAPGSFAVTTFAEGDFDLVGTPEALMQGWISAGPLGRYPANGSASGFTATWLGKPPFDPQTEMQWAAKMYGYLAKSYKYLDPPPPFRVFIRVLDSGGGGATALANSFMLSTGPGGSGEGRGQSPRGTMTHEMGHMWVGSIDGPQGVISWFTEGLNTYYTRLIPMRGGFDSVEEYGRSLNATFRDYYTNVARNLSADSIVKIGFNDNNVRHIPYVRGSMYFADLDSKIRAASKGKRNLDSLMLDIFRMRQSGGRFDHEAWIQAVTKEIGPSARAEFEAVILRGETIVPASDAFGPCFERRAAKMTPPGRGGSDAAAIDGYEWVRMPSIPDERCRTS
jgi:hypothetical protein